MKCEITGKECYTSQAQARAKVRMCGKRIRPYFCQSCRYWHIAITGASADTSIPKDRRRQRRRGLDDERNEP